MTAPLVEHHVLEYPGGYTRSIGPALSRYFGGLRDGKIVRFRQYADTAKVCEATLA